MVSAIDHFDDVVIGSSPLMLLQARSLARAGRRVCLVERDARLGGSWQTAILENGQEVEIACHLVEFFPGMYELLQEAADVPFVALDAQPIRIHPSGLIVPYLSRLLMLATGMRLILGWAKARIAWAMGRASDRNRLLNFERKLHSYLRYQVPAFFHRPVLKGPAHGFVDFMDRLIARTRAAGVQIRHVDITQMVYADDQHWQLSDTQGGLLSADHVHCTTSSNLHPVAKGRFAARTQEFSHRFCSVVEVDDSAVRISQSYVAFWNDPEIARISRIDMAKAQKSQRFLVEFQNADLRARDDLHAILQGHLERARIIAKGGDFALVGEVDCLFTTNVDQLPAGEIDTNLWGYYSMGNLAAGLAAWRASKALPSSADATHNTGAET